LDLGEERRDHAGGFGEGNAVKLTDLVKRPGQQRLAAATVRFEIALVIYGVEGFFVVIHVQMVSHDVGAVVFVHAGGFGAGVVEPIREQVLAAVGTGQVGQRWLGRG
jgi:hypothetical protein